MDNFCEICGSKLEDNKCPKCDVEKEETRVVSTGKTNGLSIAGFVLSLLSFVFFPSLIFGLIFSITGLVQVNKNGDEGKELAIAGIIISATILLSILLITLIANTFFNTLF